MVLTEPLILWFLGLMLHGVFVTVGFYVAINRRLSTHEAKIETLTERIDLMWPTIFRHIEREQIHKMT